MMSNEKLNFRLYMLLFKDKWREVSFVVVLRPMVHLTILPGSNVFNIREGNVCARGRI